MLASKQFTITRQSIFSNNNFTLKLINCILIQRYSDKSKHFPYQIININKEEALSKIATNSSLLQSYRDSRIIYSCYIQKHKLKGPYYLKKQVKENILAKQKEGKSHSFSLIIEKLFNEYPDKNIENSQTLSLSDNLEQFPYAHYENVNLAEIPNPPPLKSNDEQFAEFSVENQPSISEDIAFRLKTYNEKTDEGNDSQVAQNSEDKECEIKFYEDTLLTDFGLESHEIDSQEYVNQHGTPDPNHPKSSIPCGGCGALLHCQDESLPGYLPSEIFKGKSRSELMCLLCQRCFYLTKYKAALNVRISPKVYEEALQLIRSKKALVLVVLDLIDTPCSVWPGLYNMIGKKQPVIVIGNKVDLLPLDNSNYLETIKASLVESIKSTNLWKTSIQNICLVSAKTGYGMESLITKIQTKWGIQGDIYIIGCTNAGKSTLFNELLRSDLCKIQASNLIQRATASPWPGTTLNLLKFPLFRPTGHRMTARRLRLKAMEEAQEEKLINSPLPMKKYWRQASLTGHIGQSFKLIPDQVDLSDPFKINAHKLPHKSLPRLGINEKAPEFVHSKWCFDTPGTIQPDQFLGLLTHDELIDVMPKKMLVPRTFLLHSSQSLFIAGLARLDLLYTPCFARIAVCCSDSLPITIVPTRDASAVYRSYLGTPLLNVPRGSKSRLERWSVLKPTNIRLVGKGLETAADIVLSSAGFASVTLKEELEIDLRCWTPGGRGVYLRSPSMLPNITALRGKRIYGTPAYRAREISYLYKSSTS